MTLPNEPCRYCGGDCPSDHEHMCDGYSGDIDNLYEEEEKDMTLPVETVRKAVAAKGTQFATVTFVKKDGTERTINGLFKPTSKIIGNERGERNSKAMARNGLIPIYSVAEQHWKCFNENAVLEIK